jgi:hypothetical protein
MWQDHFTDKELRFFLIECLLQPIIARMRFDGPGHHMAHLLKLSLYSTLFSTPANTQDPAQLAQGTQQTPLSISCV